MIEHSVRYPSKILLIGEYSILSGGSGLSIPCDRFYAKWMNSDEIDPRLESYYQFLNSDSGIKEILDLNNFKKDISNFLKLDSNIQSGYGLGSSGSLVASVYDRYAYRKEDNLDVLKRVFSKMESFFHGKSSGLDPLVSYLNKPILTDTNNIVGLASEISLSHKLYRISLVDSFKTRNTQQCIEIFNDLMKDKDIESKFKLNVALNNSRAIEAIISQNMNQFIESWKKISQSSYEILYPLIPNSILEIWLQGLQSEKYYLKFCGAGGGGYFLKLELIH
ncbi:MAG: mevalonate kinase [Saprospiraceae bacterium]|nr:mevalonate kinase [Saprospiraceae bacterium]